MHEVIDLTQEEQHLILLWDWYLTNQRYSTRRRLIIQLYESILISIIIMIIIFRIKVHFTKWRWPEFTLSFVIKTQVLVRHYQLLHVLYRHLTTLEFANLLPEHTKLTCMGIASSYTQQDTELDCWSDWNLDRPQS